MGQMCADCGSPMEAGFLADFGESNVARAGTWVEGVPEFARFLGMKVGLNLKNRRNIGVSALRCRRCGLLKLYAREQG
ncbi:MAG TPA: hypothetical protein VFQ39_00330 [Longimicrobium sp.]|nr:hypothetical protein [Longimicrobium sp.]